MCKHCSHRPTKENNHQTTGEPNRHYRRGATAATQNPKRHSTRQDGRRNLGGGPRSTLIAEQVNAAAPSSSRLPGDGEKAAGRGVLSVRIPFQWRHVSNGPWNHMARCPSFRPRGYCAKHTSFSPTYMIELFVSHCLEGVRRR